MHGVFGTGLHGAGGGITSVNDGGGGQTGKEEDVAELHFYGFEVGQSGCCGQGEDGEGGLEVFERDCCVVDNSKEKREKMLTS